MEEQLQTESPSKIIGLLIVALIEVYSPVGTQEQLEFKTTLDIMEEMAQITDVSGAEIIKALENTGFQTTYNDAGFFWKMYRRSA